MAAIHDSLDKLLPADAAQSWGKPLVIARLAIWVALIVVPWTAIIVLIEFTLP
jgi:hypothetical protein